VTTPPKDPREPHPDEREAKIARLERELAEALARNAAGDAVIADQRARLQTLGTGREEGMRALATARAELRRVTRERDELRHRLMSSDDEHTVTVTLPDDFLEREPDHGATLPSIEDLMAGLEWMREPMQKASAGHLHMSVQTPTDESEEMLAPEIVFPEHYAATAQTGDPASARVARVLVLLDGEQPIKYPLYKTEMTVGRSEFADIQIDSHFISRLHARLVTTADGVAVEDVDSKNGVKVNAKATSRQTLRHGDLVSLGGLRFRFLDAGADDAG
jgi:hypothetical protein